MSGDRLRAPHGRDAAIGPLGLAAVTYDSGTTGGAAILDSPDGHDFTTHTVAELAGGGDWNVAGISMNADAVIVRLLPVTDEPSGSTEAPGPQRLLVGTPR